VFLTTDSKLYYWDGSAWQVVVADAGDVNFNDLQGTIAAGQIPSGTITEAKLASDSVTAAKISANAVGANAIAAGVITGDKITANTITGGLLSTSGIITSAAQITNGVISNAKIADAAITSAKIQDLAVTSAKIGDLNADKITAGVINAARIPTLSTAKFDIMSGDTYGINKGQDTAAVSGTCASVTFTPTATSTCIVQVGAMISMPSASTDSVYDYDFTLKINNVQQGSAVIFSQGDGATGINSLTLAHGFTAYANTSYTIQVDFLEEYGRAKQISCPQGALSAIFTQT
jgi:hypothetical protein